MAAIRFPIGGHYRYYGSRAGMPSQPIFNKESKIMKFIAVLILTVILTIASALIGCFFLYAGWNWGLVPAVHDQVRSIDLGTAFWLSLCLATIGGFFKTSVTAKD